MQEKKMDESKKISMMPPWPVPTRHFSANLHFGGQRVNNMSLSVNFVEDTWFKGEDPPDGPPYKQPFKAAEAKPGETS